MVYKVKYGCSNCGRVSKMEFPEEQKAPDKTTYPHRGCYSAHKKW